MYWPVRKLVEPSRASAPGGCAPGLAGAGGEEGGWDARMAASNRPVIRPTDRARGMAGSSRKMTGVGRHSRSYLPRRGHDNFFRVHSLQGRAADAVRES